MIPKLQLDRCKQLDNDNGLIILIIRSLSLSKNRHSYKNWRQISDGDGTSSAVEHEIPSPGEVQSLSHSVVDVIFRILGQVLNMFFRSFRGDPAGVALTCNSLPLLSWLGLHIFFLGIPSTTVYRLFSREKPGSLRLVLR